MSVAIVTGSGGLIGSEAVYHLASQGLDVVGVDNDMRARFFGDDASTAWNVEQLRRTLPKQYSHFAIDIRDESAVQRLFSTYRSDICLIIHTAAQPSHDWAAREPLTDFSVNATGTLVLLEATRKYCPAAPFIYTSTNKVYGDRPNSLPLEERASRWELPADHPWYAGIPEEMSVDACLHSLFGASKLAADLVVQEYGRYFQMHTVCFRGGCLTGPRHSGTQLHGFLAYLMKCAALGTDYTVYGYMGKQVRDNIHAQDLVAAFWQFFQAPRCGEVYNIGGGRFSECSMLEAINKAEAITRRPMRWTYSETNRVGDHMWWISDCSKFADHYPAWRHTKNVDQILREIYEEGIERWVWEATDGAAAQI